MSRGSAAPEARGRRPHPNGKFLRAITLGLLALAMLAETAVAETVVVKYRGPVDLTSFDCETVTRSSFVRRVCYDAANEYMIIKLKRNYYHYCEIDAGTVADLKAAESMGRYYIANIKGAIRALKSVPPPAWAAFSQP